MLRKKKENAKTVGIAVAVAISHTHVQKPIATAIAIPIPTPIPMAAGHIGQNLFMCHRVRPGARGTAMDSVFAYFLVSFSGGGYDYARLKGRNL